MQRSRLDYTEELFRLICARESTTRGELARATPRSLMSVGKAVSLLLSAGLITEAIAPAAGAGRRAGLLAAVPASFAVVDLTTRRFCVTLFDLRQRETAHLTHAYNEEIFFEENLYIFADRVGHFFHRREDAACVGAGLLLPGRYDPEHDRVFCARSEDFGDVRPRAVFAEKLGAVPLLIDEDLSMGAMFAAGDAAPGAASVLYLKLDLPLGAALILNGTPFRGAHAGEGALSRLAPRTSSPALFADVSFLDRLNAIAELLNSYLTLFVPDAIVLECADFAKDSGTTEVLGALLRERFGVPAALLPPLVFVAGDGSFARRGICASLRHRWFESRLS